MLLAPPDNCPYSQTPSIALCDNRRWTGSHIRLHSNAAIILGNTIYSTPCTCDITLPPRVELRVTTLLAFKRPNRTPPYCSQRLSFTSTDHNHELWRICAESTGQGGAFLGCLNHTQVTGVSFVSQDPGYRAGFEVCLSGQYRNGIATQTECCNYSQSFSKY